MDDTPEPAPETRPPTPGTPNTGTQVPATPVPGTIGQRLRAGRERAGLSVAAAAEKLHLDIKVIEALEADRFADLGASVYVRGHLRRYGDFVGEHGAELVSSYGARSESRPPPPDLTQVPHPERRADPRRLVTPMVGLGCALVLAIAIWWVLAGSRASETTAAVDPAPAATAPAAIEPPAVRVADAAPASAPAAAPPVGSATTAPPATVATDTRREAGAQTSQAPARSTRLTLELSGESWVEVYDARGERLFYDVASAGSVQSIEGRPPLRVVLGNAAGVSVQVDGQAREIPASAVSGEGARFVVNRSGSLSRARQ
jgi:cytoskeleton protein RodZ